MKSYYRVTLGLNHTINVRNRSDAVQVDFNSSLDSVGLEMTRPQAAQLKTLLERVLGSPSLTVDVRRSSVFEMNERRLKTHQELDKVMLADLPLSVRTLQALKNERLETVQALLGYSEPLLRLPNFGQKSLYELIMFLSDFDLTLKPEASYVYSYQRSVWGPKK